jgi:hypothetical protein
MRAASRNDKPAADVIFETVPGRMLTPAAMLRWDRPSLAICNTRLQYRRLRSPLIISLPQVGGNEHSIRRHWVVYLGRR